MAGRDFCEELQRLVNDDNIHAQVQEMAKVLLQEWALLLKAVDEENLSFMHEAYMECQRDGIHFPPVKSQPNPSLVDTNGPPEWAESPMCIRCRSEFSFSVRQHHCRRCGKSFCHACSSRELPLPEYGLPEPVRVCEPCYVDRTNGQIKREPSRVTLPGECRRGASPIDADVEEAIKLSLMEDRLRQARLASSTADEEAQVASAIAASLQGSRGRVSTNATKIDTQKKEREKDLVTLGERETLNLFWKLVKQMLAISKTKSTKASDIEVEGDLKNTAEDLKKIKSRLQEAIEKGVGGERTLRELDDLDDALFDFEALQVEHEKLCIKEKYNLKKEATTTDEDEEEEEREKITFPIQFPPLPYIKSDDPPKERKEVKKEPIPE